MPEVKTQSERVSARGLAQSRAHTRGQFDKHGTEDNYLSGRAWN